jgi:hypothetical protein
MLRKIFGPKREEDRSWRKLQNDKPHSLYSSLNIVWVIKSRKMRWAGRVARMAEERCVYRLGGPKVRDLREDLGVGGSITLSCTLWR